jgi:hypothetical protein
MHRVYLNPAGLVVVAGDDLVEPIICYSPSAIFDPSPNNPLGLMVSRDVPGRVAFVRQIQARDEALTGTVPRPLETARRKWDALIYPQAKGNMIHLPGD